MASTTSRATCPSVGRNSVWLLLMAMMMIRCEEETVEHYPSVPEIDLVGISHDTIRQYEDALLITIQYKDGDGDIGFEDPEEYALFVRDIRLESFDGFYIGPVAPPDANVPIQGELTIEFPSLFLFGNGAVEQTRFEIKLIDRAGNESNLLETELISIVRE